MDAGLAQRIALVAHGNAFLSGRIDRAPDLLAENTAFQHVQSVEFRSDGRSNRRVDLWFRALAKQGVNRLTVRPHDLAAEGNGVREVWVPSALFISRRFEKRQERYLESLIAPGPGPDPEEQFAISTIMVSTERPWHLSFERRSRRSRVTPVRRLSAARASLAERVTEAREFSRRHGMGFVGTFSSSLSLLRSRNPIPPYHPDMLPSAGYSLDARRVLAAAAQAWVFGGMGSWGDRLFEDESVEAEFWGLEAKLHAAVENALIAAANSFGDAGA
jgi:hypothetical protein